MDAAPLSPAAASASPADRAAHPLPAANATDAGALTATDEIAVLAIRAGLAALTVNGTAYTLPVDVDRDAGDRFGPGTAVYVNPPSALPDELDAFQERIDEALTAHYAEAA